MVALLIPTNHLLPSKKKECVHFLDCSVSSDDEFILSPLYCIASQHNGHLCCESIHFHCCSIFLASHRKVSITLALTAWTAICQPLPLKSWLALFANIFRNQGTLCIWAKWPDDKVTTFKSIGLGVKCRIQRLDKNATKSRFSSQNEAPILLCLIWGFSLHSFLKLFQCYPLQTLLGNHWSARCQ